MKPVIVIVAIIAGLLLSACSSGIFGLSGPSDDEATKVIVDNLPVSHVVIRDKTACELSANTKAQGVSERWIITYDDLNPYAQIQQEKGIKVTIQKYNGQWVWFNATAYCGH